MKKIVIILSILFSLSRIEAQTITLNDRDPQYGYIQNIKVESNDDYLSAAITEILGSCYSINKPNVKPDLVIKLNGRTSTSSYMTRQGGQVNSNLTTVQGSYTVNSSSTYKVDPKYEHTLWYYYNFRIGNKSFPALSEEYKIEMASEKSKYKEVSPYSGVIDYKKLLEDFKSVFPLRCKKSTFQANSELLLWKIDALNIDTVLAQGQHIDGKFMPDNNTLLIWAVRTNKRELFDKLISKNADIHAFNNQHINAAMCAKIYAREDMLKILLEKGGDINQTDITGKTIDELALTIGVADNMVLFIENKDIEKIDECFSKGFVFDKYPYKNTYYLENAILSDDTVFIDYLGKKGLPFDIDITALQYSSTLFALSSKKFNSYKYLTNKKIALKSIIKNWMVDIVNLGLASYIYNEIEQTVNTFNYDLYISLRSAAIKINDIELYKILLKKNNSKENLENFSKIFVNNNVDLARKMYQNVSLEEFNTRDYEILLENCRKNKELYYWYLSEEGLGLLTKDFTKNMNFKKQIEGNMVDAIIKGPDTEKAIEYLEKNPNYLENLYPYKQVKLICYFVEKKEVDMIKYLLGKNVNPNYSIIEPDHYNLENPLIYAIKLGDMSVIKTLVEAGADVNIRMMEEYGTTNFLIFKYVPLEYAKRKSNNEIINYLVSKGAKETLPDPNDIYIEIFFKEIDKTLDRFKKGEQIPITIKDSVFLTKRGGSMFCIAPKGESFLNYIILLTEHFDREDLHELIKGLYNQNHPIFDNTKDVDMNVFFSKIEIIDDDFSLVKKLIDNGAKISSECLYRYMEISISRRNVSYRIMDLLIQSGANPNDKIPEREITIKEWAIGNKKLKNYNKEMDDFFKKY